MAATIQRPELLPPLSQEDLGKLDLYLPTLKVISYQGPGEAGGVSLALEPLIKKLGTKVHWFAISGLPSKPSSDQSLSFHKPEIPAQILQGHERACVRYLWPLLHGMSDLAQFDLEDWRAYRQVNELVAAESLRAQAVSFPTLYWLHDLQWAMVAPLLSLESGTVLCHFWHVPWPAAAIAAKAPAIPEMVTALLANKIVGFHTMEYATNFLETVQHLLPDAVVDMLKMEVRLGSNRTSVVAMPLGLDFNHWQRAARATRPKAAAIPKKYGLANQLVLGVDRLDYSKGVIEKLHGIEAFLQRQPGWLRRFHYVQLAQSPQSSYQKFADYAESARTLAQQINRKYASNGWEPILWLEGQLGHDDLAAWYQAADVLAVTPVKDGLNLIAKEFVACREDEQGVVVLSKQAGCSTELSVGALVVDAQSTEQIAEALAYALSMAVEEKRRRMLAMRHVVGWNQVQDWAVGFLRQALTRELKASAYA